MVGIERFAFYDFAREAYAVIQTGERRFWGCFMFRKGVIPPDDWTRRAVAVHTDIQGSGTDTEEGRSSGASPTGSKSVRTGRSFGRPIAPPETWTVLAILRFEVERLVHEGQVPKARSVAPWSDVLHE